MNLGYDIPDSLTPKSQIHVQKSGHFNLKLHTPSSSTMTSFTSQPQLNSQSLTKESAILQSRKIQQAQIWEPTNQTIKLKSSTILNLSKHAQVRHKNLEQHYPEHCNTQRP